ncbi:hypothetical protein F4805DRAFT_401503 [Annulohypoxylon moriforme]|nr:hypothetical protein F4805DRAFT_401503 [Annulohypoxylon moriforme]
MENLAGDPTGNQMQETQNGTGQQRENGREQTQMEGGTAGITEGEDEEEREEVFEICRIRSLSSTSPGPGASECSICYRTFPHDSLTTLPCGHVFNNKCISDWTQVYDRDDFAEGRVRCPMCRYHLLYDCGDVISQNHLRPGVKILPRELTLNCQSYVPEYDGHSETSVRPWNPRAIVEGRRRQIQIRPRLIPPNFGVLDIISLPSVFRDPEGPANTINGDDEDELQPQADLQSDMDQRPQHHNFRFADRVARAQTPNRGIRAHTLEEYAISKHSIGVALDDGRFEYIFRAIRALEDDFEALEARYPKSIRLNNLTFDGLDTLALRIEAMYKQFKRQHEGFIQLSDVALQFRDEREEILLEQLNEFWDVMDFADEEIAEKYELLGEGPITR